MVLSPFMVTAEVCAEYMIYNLLRPEQKTGAHFINDHGDDAKKSRYYGNESVRKGVWDHAMEVTGLSSSQ